MTEFQKHRAGLVSLLMATVLIGWEPLVKTFTSSWSNDEYTYILLILPFSIALIFHEWRTAKVLPEWNPRAGASLLLTAVAIAGCAWLCSSRLTDDLRLATDMLALVLSWIGSVVLCFGRKGTRRVLFPLLLLFGIVPLPGVVMNYIVALLLGGSEWSAHALFFVFRVPVVQQGDLLAIPNLTIQVAQECSSIRSSSLLFVTAIISGGVLLHSPLRRFLVVVLAIPLSIAKNGLRIFAIAMLGSRVDPGYLTGNLHRHGGIVFLAIGLAGLFVMIAFLRKGENLLAPFASDKREELRADNTKV